MANTRSVKKNVRQNERRRLINAARHSAIKSTIKSASVAAEAGSEAEVSALLRKAAAQLARGKGKGVIHRNAAARRMSRLAKRVTKKAA